MYKLLALDIDGTLLRRDGVVDERDQRAIASLQARGVVVTLVTGRLWAGTQRLAAEVGIRGPVVCADGAELVDAPSGVEIQHRGIVGEAARLLCDGLQHHGLDAFLMVDDGVLHAEGGSRFTRYVRNWSPELRQIAALYAHPCWMSPRGIAAVVALGEPEAVRAAAEGFRSSGQLEVFDFRVARSLVGEQLPPLRAMLAHARGVSKRSGLEHAAALCGCRREEVVAVGDWLNDVEMFAAAGRSFAMGQAPETVKRAATDQLEADAGAGGGVAEAVACAWPEP
jgi:hydroxymethylpyrimidine pyrophosphatase-like HAD family hydrolase